MPDELVNMIRQWGFGVDSPNLQDMCDMPLSRIGMYFDKLTEIIMLVKDC